MDDPRTFFNRGPSPAARLVFFSVLSLLLLFVDARYRYLESTRSLLSILVAPIQRLATLPAELWHDAEDFFVSHQDLVQRNLALHRQHELDATHLQALNTLREENARLRALHELLQQLDLEALGAEIMYTELDVFKRKILVNKGLDDGVLAGQVALDNTGIIGQVSRAFPQYAEVTLITERDHAVPVMVERNGLRSIIFGAGDTSQLSLRYMPVSSDINEGDRLVTSGIDGLYPPGIPVARVTKIERDPAYPFARVTCLPLGGVDNHRHLLIVTRTGTTHPQFPETLRPATTGETTP